MASISGNGNYVSDSEIMQWLALQQDRIYGDLREAMDLSRNRASLADALNAIKTELHQANAASPSDFRGVEAKVRELLETYGSDPDYADICNDLEQTLAGPLAARAAQENDYVRKLDEHNAALKAIATLANHLQGQGHQGNLQAQALLEKGEQLEANAPTPPADHPYDDNQLKSWDELIGGKLDVVNKNDQLNMIHIQQLKALGDQSSQLGSQFIASSDKATSSIINNIA